jgi:xylulokinase
MLLLGYDVGSSSIKATILEADTGRVIASASSPRSEELDIMAVKPDWAEQDPEVWWRHVKLATAEMMAVGEIDRSHIEAIGISYQMHGLVIVDKDHRPLRPAIIWCDSRAVEIGEQAFNSMGQERCLRQFLNSPGNFTASKLKWVMDNEPDIYAKIHKAMLPGDYVAMKMTGDIVTTSSGLSEGILWDFQNQDLAVSLLDHFGLSADMIPEIVPTFSNQGELSRAAADELGLRPGIKVAYRAGDQPNNALSLNVLNPGELAATAGTSGVVYGIGDEPKYDLKSRVNTFVHVNHTPDNARYGVLLCVNGTGILNRWLRNNSVGDGKTLSYAEMNDLAAQAPVGSEGLLILPFGNGAERTLDNQDLGGSIHGLKFNIHNHSHLLRAAQEGIVFALNYGVEIMRNMGIQIDSVRAGYTNMFLSPLFAEAFATVTGAQVELHNTDGSQGAARGAGIGSGIYERHESAFIGLRSERVIEPNHALAAGYRKAYANWSRELEFQLGRND